MSKPFDKNKIDVTQAFLVFMATVGDCARTAVALDLEPSQVRELAEAEGWSEKIRRVSLMSKGGKPGDWERAQNRCLCFVQAQVLREQVNRLLSECASLTNEELMARACVKTRDGGTQLSAKFLVDMASAAESCHRMAYMALDDTTSSRQDREQDSPGAKTSDLHAAIIASLSNPTATVPASSLLLDEAQKITGAYAQTERESSAPSATLS
jgi:hypothetical protein